MINFLMRILNPIFHRGLQSTPTDSEKQRHIQLLFHLIYPKHITLLNLLILARTIVCINKQDYTRHTTCNYTSLNTCLRQK